MVRRGVRTKKTKTKSFVPFVAFVARNRKTEIEIKGPAEALKLPLSWLVEPCHSRQPRVLGE
jgi:hypothetical protein